MNTLERQEAVARLRALPDALTQLVAPLDTTSLTTAYMPGEWTVAQNVHHVADTHAMLYGRAKMIATENKPIIKPFDPDAWAALPDAQSADLSLSLSIIRGLHIRASAFFEALPEEAFAREGLHLDLGLTTLGFWLGRFANHGYTHIAQIQKTLAAR
jgi:DinB superfamily